LIGEIRRRQRVSPSKPDKCFDDLLPAPVGRNDFVGRRAWGRSDSPEDEARRVLGSTIERMFGRRSGMPSFYIDPCTNAVDRSSRLQC
jgi:hypothetical protein